MTTENDFKLENGESHMRSDKPIISIVGKGHQTYLWIGNNNDTSKGCYATLSGMKTLERLAFTLLRQLGHKPNWMLPKKKVIKKKNQKPKTNG